VSIAKQTSLMKTTNINKLNLRLVQASQYIQMFNVEIHHKPRCTHLVLDALSHLLSYTKDEPEDSLEAV
jgi:hypothetical protein